MLCLGEFSLIFCAWGSLIFTVLIKFGFNQIILSKIFWSHSVFPSFWDTKNMFIRPPEVVPHLSLMLLIFYSFCFTCFIWDGSIAMFSILSLAMSNLLLIPSSVFVNADIIMFISTSCIWDSFCNLCVSTFSALDFSVIVSLLVPLSTNSFFLLLVNGI